MVYTYTEWEGTEMIIGICDDDKIWERKASYIIGEYRKKVSLDIDIQYFPDRESLLNYEGEPLEALFLDIELGDENGIELAEEVHIGSRNHERSD